MVKVSKLVPCDSKYLLTSESVEFVLGIIKIVAVLGFILFGIIVDCGGVPSDDRGYIGFRYWNGKNGNHAFRNGKRFSPNVS